MPHWEHVTGCIVGRSQASGISVVLCENPAPAIHVTLESVTDPFHEQYSLKTVASLGRIMLPATKLKRVSYILGA